MLYCRKDRVLPDIVITVLLLCGFLLFTGLPLSAQDQEIPTMAPLNQKFVDYMNLKSVPRLSFPNVISDGYALGYIPSPLDLSHLAGKSISPAVSIGSIPMEASPLSYDLRTYGKVTAVRNQLSCGDCWAFAAMGSLESNLLTAETWDFSENNLKNTHGFDWGACAGGNGEMAAAYLVRWGYPGWSAGPALETADPYNPSSGASPAGLTVQKHVQEVLYIPIRGSSTDNDNIKQAIMTYGGVEASYYDNHNNAAYYKSANAAYYFNGVNDSNHAITIIGWDDNFAAGNFSILPPGNGAFLIKNSWGTSFGQSGYFWISYYDTTLGYDTSYVFNGGQPTTNYARVYQYDPLGWTSGLGSGSTTGWFANIFTAAATEQLTAVSFYVASPNSPYEIYVYSNVSAGAPRSGSLGSTNTGTMAMPGYHTVALTSPVSVMADHSFSVVVKLTTPGYNWPIPMEYPWSGYSTGATASAGQSFISSSGISWSDITTLPNYSNTNVCIKAFAGSDITPPTDGSLAATPGNGQVSLIWTAASDSGGLNLTNAYRVVRDTLGTPSAQCASGTQVYMGSGTSTTDTGRTNGTTYYYRVCAYDAVGNVSNGATASTTLPVSITVTTSPSGLQFTVDSTTYTTPQSYVWNPGTSHAIAALPSPQSGTTGTQYVVSSWSDGGAQSHSIAPVADGTYTANFTTQYQLTRAASPGGGGTISANCSGGCWYNSGATASLLASPNSGYVMGSWTGDCSGSGLNPSATVLMNGVKACTANFTTCADNPARNTQNPTPYTLLQSAYDDTTPGSETRNGDTIWLLATTLPEILDLNRNISVTLSGGWDCGFGTQTSFSIIHGSLTVGKDSLSVTAEKLIVY